jgi:PBP1b-binding outer membrane lipoprotein LpoB
MLMNQIHSGLLLAGALLLAGCAADPAASAAASAAGAQAAAQEQATDSKWDDDKLTGSRLAKRSTDRMLKAVGAQEVRDAMDSNPRPLNANP